MITHRFTHISEITEVNVKTILEREPKTEKIKNEFDGKFDGSDDGKGFDCYFSINDWIVCITNSVGGIIKVYIMIQPCIYPDFSTDDYKLSEKFAIVAQEIMTQK